ncbi:uncharacterized protein LY89DRAFT_733318 [Mollisia scopiformis]|uniref:Glycoside hydrolase family 31 protein n=1 Tax=Mollisia scopiformis TaxID=149040 RepID=A0A194XCJ2_MOLSC|nr:uncharacterized protein LY89DRAFT_733318 [Mollisia scopiformis]KUJ17467.1 hypothetical protein LY89DRAFT_733318 [Mollisia scopiformis]
MRSRGLSAASAAVLCFVDLAGTSAIPSTTPVPILITANGQAIVNNIAVLVGNTNTSLTPITSSTEGVELSWQPLKNHVIKIEVETNYTFVGAQFTIPEEDKFFGVWEYPFNGQLDNSNASFEDIGVGNEDGINWSNARAPFFITTAGYGVYTDTLSIGSYDFSSPNMARFVFNSSSLVYYIILPKTEGDFKSIIKEYTALSARIEMPPDSAYGPNFWSDDFEQDFHGNATNAQENYFDVIDHLAANQIRATSMFADRPYGTGNSSFGNFDFDPQFYPTPKKFISDLSAAGFDFQVWVANRGFLNTELYNASVANDWLFPGISPIQFLGPALNLSIPAAYDYFKLHLKNFTDLGVKGFKIDRGEEGELPDYEQNLQNTLFEQLCHEVMVEAWGLGNYYSFARSAVDRARSLTGVWNGDSHSNFTGLQYTVTSGIRAGLLGFSMWGSDTGGYVRDTNSPTEELWARWMWFSAFSPVFEIMVGTGHTPWYAPYTSRLVSILKTTANLHVALVPYIRTYTYKATQTGLPVIRALWLEYPDEMETVRDIKDQYIFGEEFLVAPIVNGGNSRSVYFPGEKKWLNYLSRTSTPQVYQGGKTISNITATIEDMPVYVKEGAIIPTGDLHQNNAKWDKDWQPVLNFELFPSFDVDNSTFSYFSKETNKTVIIQMTVDSDEGSGNVTITSGDFGGLEKAWNVTSIGQLWVYVAGTIQKLAIPVSGGISGVTMEKSIWD